LTGIEVFSFHSSSGFPSILVQRENEPQNPQKLAMKLNSATQLTMAAISPKLLAIGLMHSYSGLSNTPLVA